MRLTCRPLTALIGLVALLAIGSLMVPSQVQAEPQQSLAILLKQLKAQPLGLYDGMRLFRVPLTNGETLTLSLSCEREVWRVQSTNTAHGRSSFYENSSFLSAQGVRETWLCREPARVLD